MPSPYPSVDRISQYAVIVTLTQSYGRTAVMDAIRAVLAQHRTDRDAQGDYTLLEPQICDAVQSWLMKRSTPSLRRLFNLTGTVLHTNLGRARLSQAAMDHAAMAMGEACNLEFDLETGQRGERDSLVETLLTELTGAQAATVVNNNAAAVLLTLAGVAQKRQVVVSRGELIEIGGSFRIPDVMRSANVRLIEVGTTNRTHRSDYANAIGPSTAALMKVHASNYVIQGFTAAVCEADMADVAHEHGLPLIVDLGAGSLIDLSAYGLPKEPIVADIIAAGADLVTFSGDKLLGGPQAGLIVGKKALIDRINRHPLKRALRVSKLTLAALEATLMAYRHPERLTQDLPTLRLLTRPLADIEAIAQRVQPHLSAALGPDWQVTIQPVFSQVGSGSLPIDVIPSMALVCTFAQKKSGSALKALTARLRQLPIPIIGRVTDNSLVLDLRCLEDEGDLLTELQRLDLKTYG
jgi:L-seryl-tRNA(Ser) seleniumtransferase